MVTAADRRGFRRGRNHPSSEVKRFRWMPLTASRWLTPMFCSVSYCPSRRYCRCPKTAAQRNPAYFCGRMVQILWQSASDQRRGRSESKGFSGSEKDPSSHCPCRKMPREW